MQNPTDYTLNFVVPVGPTGPTGPTGPQGISGVTGPTGPASLSDLIFAQFSSSAKTGNLDIYNNTILPNNSVVFVPTANQIQVNESGNYEFTIFGTLGALAQNESVSISMIVTGENGNSYSEMIASIVADISLVYFSKTIFITFTEKQTIELYFRKDNSYIDSAIYDVTLLIKKLNF